VLLSFLLVTLKKKMVRSWKGESADFKVIEFNKEFTKLPSSVKKMWKAV
jgi:hypothetical protein